MLQTELNLAARLAEIEAPTAHLLEVRGDLLLSRPRRRAARRSHGRGRSWAGATTARVEELARRHLIEQIANSELGWRPWLGRAMRVDGIEQLDAALARGRGVVIGLPHVGPMLLLIHALCARGVRPYLVATGARSGVVSGPAGRWREFQRRHREAAGCRTVWPGEAFPAARALLERGEVLVVPWDVRGSARVRLLDRPARVSAGAGHLAVATGAAVLPGLVWRERARPCARLGPPIDAGAGADAVLEALAADLDRALRQRLPQAHKPLANVLR